jgi:hypothetical protein
VVRGLYKPRETRNALRVRDLPRGTVTFLFTDARETCGQFEAEWARGRALTREEALAEALSNKAAKTKA